MFNIVIDVNNDAFYPPKEFGNRDVGLMNRVMANELDIIMNDVTDKIREGQKEGTCRDSNGKCVGYWNLWIAKGR